MQTHYRDVSACVTRDGSIVRELMHPAVHGNRAQNLAEATVPAGRATLLHRHGVSEEVYHVTAGAGRMTPGAEIFDVGAGDTVCIPPGTPHRIASVCCSSPAYGHDDTELLEG